MNKQQAIERMGAFLSAWRTPEGLAMTTEDFAWENYLPDHVPFGGRYEGERGLDRYMTELAENWITGSFVYDHFIYDAEERALIAIGYEEDGKSTKTGRICDMPFVFEVRFAEDGRLNYFREYNDTAAIGATFDT